MSEVNETPNVLKVRDDTIPLQFTSTGDKFTLQDGAEASWLGVLGIPATLT